MSMSLGSIVERSREWFAKCFGASPKWVVAAPGRVNLIGEHTDYNDGFVLPIALDRFTVIAGRAHAGKEAVIHNVTTGDTAEFQVSRALQPGEPAWSNYVRGVIAGTLARNRKVRGFEAVIDSDVPFGGGLASSAALSVSAATFLEALGGFVFEPREKAVLCQEAEHQFAGVPCGIMDQISSVLARQDCALLLDCRSLAIRPVSLGRNSGVTIIVINTGVRHKIAETEYAERRSQCQKAAAILGVKALRDATVPMLDAARSALPPVLYRRARHVIVENERTVQAASAIEAKEWTALGNLMYASHESLRVDYQVSSTELDTIVQIAHDMGPKEGMLGCRMTGGGFGGSAVALVKTELAQHVIRVMGENYAQKTSEDIEIFATRPSAGARIVE